MKWFEGDITEAVTTSKKKNAIFVVFIEGSDSISTNVATSINSSEVSTALETEDFVSIKLKSDSEAYTQFAQIYQFVPVPSIFFIGSNGIPLEIIAGEVTSSSLETKINTVLEKSGKKSPQDSFQTLSSSVRNVSSSESLGASSQAFLNDARIQEPNKEEKKIESNTKSNDDKINTKAAEDTANEIIASSSNESTNNAVDETNLNNQNLTAQEKIERAKEIIEKKRALKKFEEEQSDKQKEMERRKMGQDVQKMKKWQQEEELKQLKQERQREKAEEQAARERILKQIADDRAERAARFSNEKAVEEARKKKEEEERKKKLEEQRAQETINYNNARIQFRFPDGTSVTHEFSADSSLEEARTFIVSQTNFSLRDFTMSTTFPRRMFTANDFSQNLRDLQLTPTSVILILPVSSSSAVRSSSEVSVISQLIWKIFSPVLSVINYLRNLVFGRAHNPSSSSGESTRPDHSFTVSRDRGGRKKDDIPKSSFSQEGNIHRLSNQRDQDDENNTWNGNSTQQK